MTKPRCPECGTEVGTTWRWCLACGYDPDGVAEDVRQAAIEARLRRASWKPVLVIVAALLIASFFLVRTAPEDGSSKAGPTTQPLTWVPFSPPEGGFSMELPGPPTEVTSALPGPGGTEQALHTYVVLGPDALFSVGIFELDRAPTGDGQGELDDYVHRIADFLGATVSTSSPRTVNGRSALDFVISSEGTVRQGRVVLVDTRIYELSVSAPAPSATEVDHLVDSFSPA